MNIESHDTVLDDYKEALKEALEGMVLQFGYRGVRNDRPVLYTGGLSALELAFTVLGWPDPYYLPEKGNICDVEGCSGLVCGGTPWGEVYVFLCSEHMGEASRGSPRPSIRDTE